MTYTMTLKLKIHFLYLFMLCCCLLPNPRISFAENNSDTITKLKASSELDYPPFCIVNPDGRADGFSVELLKAAAESVGLELDFSIGPWNEIKQNLIDKKIDVLPLVSYSKERDTVFDFSVPYLRMNGTIFVRKGETSIRDKNDLKNKEVITIRGDTAHEYAIKNNLTDNLILTESFDEAFNMLSSGKHDAIIIQQLVGYQLIKKLKIKNLVNVSNIEEKNFKPVGKPLSGFEQKFCFAVKEGDQKLQSMLNEGLSIVITNGKYDELYDKWFGKIIDSNKITLKSLIKYIITIFTPFLLAITAFGVWYLKREVAKKTITLIEKEERIGLLLNSTAEAIYGLDLNGNCTFVNHACLRILGYGDDEDLIGRHMHTLIHHTKPDGLGYSVDECHILKALQRKEGCHIDNELLWKADGTSFPAEYWSYPITKNDEIIGLVVTFIDITKRKQTEEEKAQLEAKLSQSLKMEAIGTLAGGIAHDFNNILGVIIGYTEIARDDAPSGSPIISDLDKVLQAAHRARDLVKQILAFSRQTQTERIAMKPQPIIKEALKMLRSSLPTTIEIVHDISQDCGSIIADPTQFYQILMNICTNAFHAMESKGGTLKVALKIAKDVPFELKKGQLEEDIFIELSISDTGHGIRPDLIDKIFNPFFTTKDVGKGTGMGLSIVYGIVKDHGGAITVKSQLGRGTTFYVYLPQIKQEKEAKPLKDTATPEGNERILFVDDETLLADMGKVILERLGYHVTVKQKSFEALEEFQNNPEKFDLVITDQTMPGITGLDLARRILQISPDMPIILCTGYSNLVDEDAAKAQGIKGFVFKPMTKGNIAKLIRKILDESNSGST